MNMFLNVITYPHLVLIIGRCWTNQKQIKAKYKETVKPIILLCVNFDKCFFLFDIPQGFPYMLQFFSKIIHNIGMLWEYY